MHIRYFILLAVAVISFATPLFAAEDDQYKPPGAMQFCARHPGECSVSARADAPTSDILLIETIFASMNEAMEFPDSNEAKQVWNRWDVIALGSKEGAYCNDRAVTVRHELIAAGVPAGSIALAWVDTYHGAPHIVLLVNLAEYGVIVLDSRFRNIYPLIPILDNYTWHGQTEWGNLWKWHAAS